MPRRLKATLAGALAAGGGWPLRLIAGRRPEPLILAYHRVVEDFAESSKGTIPAMLISTRMLERHLEWLAAHYEVLPLEEAVAGPGRKGGKPRAAVTFDDGYADLYHNAFPILKKVGIPAAVFVVSAHVGTSMVPLHDRVHHLLSRGLRRKEAMPARLSALLARCGGPRRRGDAFALTTRLLTGIPRDELLAAVDRDESMSPLCEEHREEMKALTWEMLATMERAGILIGSHTRTHALLPLESPERVRDELLGSRRELEARLGSRVLHLAYPDGRFTLATIRAVQESGYRYAYTLCDHGAARRGPWSVPRRALWENSCVDGAGAFSESIMSCLVSGGLDAFHRCRWSLHRSAESAVRAGALAINQS